MRSLRLRSGIGRSDFLACCFGISFAARLLLSCSTLSAAEQGNGAVRVILNEVMYHPPDDRDDLQFIELWNIGSGSVDLSGWSFSKGLDFVFPKGAELPAGAFVLVCRDKKAFDAHYGAQLPVAGVFKGKLSHNGERVELVDAQGKVIDSLKYSDKSPWPMGADGYGGSLERICPNVSGDEAANWSASSVQSRETASGTPGRQNSSFSLKPLPQISDVHFDKAEPQRPVTVTASVTDTIGVKSVTLVWWSPAANGTASKAEVPMKRTSGDGKQGIYTASIPAQAEGKLIRFNVRAESVSSSQRLYPAATEPRPTLSYSTFKNNNDARVPFFNVLALGAMEQPSDSMQYGRRRRSRDRALPATEEKPLSAGSAVIVMLPGSKEVLTFDHVRLRPRKGGWKVHFIKDQTFEGMTGLNLIFEHFPRFVLAEPLAFNLFRAADVPAPISYHVRLWMDNQLQGYYLLVEQPNKSFLRRNSRDEDGDLYKLIWYMQGVVGQHEKKTNPHTGHSNIVQVIDGLNRTRGPQQWQFIQQHFDVKQMASYYAVNMCIQNWDGFFNNYYAFRSSKPDGKWEVFPWDEDKTWGYYDGGPSKYNWYSMPLTIGMNGDRSGSKSFFEHSGPHGGPSWWRHPGWFSGPLLANPEFRKQFETRLVEICNTVFTSEKIDPFINVMENRLEPEIRVRAQLTGDDPESAMRQFKNDIESFRQQVIHRRKFILKELGK